MAEGEGIMMVSVESKRMMVLLSVIYTKHFLIVFL
jgi:hypothetical protein